MVSTMGVNVRKAELDDLDAIVAFGSAVIPPYYTPILGERAAQAQLAWWTAGRMAPAVEANRVCVAAADRDVVGVCETGELAGEQVIWKMYLAPEYRGRSLGVELLRQAIASLPQGVGSVDVEHFAGNTRAAKVLRTRGLQGHSYRPARHRRVAEQRHRLASAATAITLAWRSGRPYGRADAQLGRVSQ
jgi:ribosomal protein S18 acetylase RimI-like enzyme